MKKILELHVNEEHDGNEEETYTVKIEKGYSQLDALSHLLKAVAEGLTEFQHIVKEVDNQHRELTKKQNLN